MGIVHKNMNKLSLIENILYDCDSSNGVVYHLINPTQDILHEKSNLVITLVRSMIFQESKKATYKYYMNVRKLSDLSSTEMQILADCTDEIIEVLVKHNARLNKTGIKSVSCQKFNQHELALKQHRIHQMQQQGIPTY